MLAPRLQAGLQRFAKPWWKRRALRIFRDESSLSANPHLWSSITDALDRSGWFVLLLSPEAAESPWVDSEVEYWLEHKDPGRIIPVLTDGDFTWFDDDFISDAAPPALRGAFSDEPRWVDLRFARTEEQLDLKNPGFSAAIADVASAIRGIPKEELESEEVRQHRRTVRTASAGVAVVVAFAVLAAGAAVFAFAQRDEARDQATIARTRELASASLVALDEDPELSLLLALEAASTGELGSGERMNLRNAVREHRALQTFEWPHDMFWTTFGALSPDGSLVALTGEQTLVEVRDLAGDPSEPLWTVDGFPSGVLISPIFTTDGKQLAVHVGENIFDASVPPPEDRSVLGMYFYDVRTGELVSRLPHVGPCRPFWMWQNEQSAFLDASAPMVAAVDNVLEFDPVPDCNTATTETWWLVDIETGEPFHITEEPAELAAYEVSPGARQLSKTYPGAITIEDLDTGDVVASYTSEDLGVDGFVRLSPGGKYLATASRLFDASTGALAVELPDNATCNVQGTYNVDETRLYRSCDDGVVYVIDIASGEEVLSLRGHDGLTYRSTSNADDRILVSGSPDGTVRVWHLETRGEVAAHDLGSGYHADAGIDVAGSQAIALVYPEDETSMFDQATSHMVRSARGNAVVFDLVTGAEQARVDGVTGKVARFSPDATRVAVQTATDIGEVAAVAVFDTVTGDRIVDMKGTCPWVPGTSPVGDCSFTGVPFAADAVDLSWSLGGALLAMAGGSSQRVAVWDAWSGDLIYTSDPLGAFALSAIQFSPDGSTLVVSSKSGMWVFDTATWAEVHFIANPGQPSWVLRFNPDGSELIAAEAHTGSIAVYDTGSWEQIRTLEGGAGQSRDMAVSGDGTLVALSSNDGLIHVMSVETGEIVEVLSLGEADVTNVEFIDDDRHLLVTDGLGPVQVLTLDIDELVSIGRSRVTRPFTDQECDTYHIDPCPTVEEIRSR